MTKGKFIVIEGPDGVGKTTQVNLLKEVLAKKGYDVKYVREPGGTPLAEDIRKIILSNVMPYESNVFLFNVARTDLFEKVTKPALDAGTVVVTDRFVPSTHAYQGAGGGQMALIEVLEYGDFVVKSSAADLIIYMTVSESEYQVLADRLGRREHLDVIERIGGDFHQRARDYYRTKATGHLAPNEFAISALGTVEEVHERIMEQVIRILEDV